MKLRRTVVGPWGALGLLLLDLYIGAPMRLFIEICLRGLGVAW